MNVAITLTAFNTVMAKTTTTAITTVVNLDGS